MPSADKKTKIAQQKEQLHRLSVFRHDHEIITDLLIINDLLEGKKKKTIHPVMYNYACKIMEKKYQIKLPKWKI